MELKVSGSILTIVSFLSPKWAKKKPWAGYVHTVFNQRVGLRLRMPKLEGGAGRLSQLAIAS